MWTKTPLKDQSHSLTKKLLPWALYALLPLALLHLYFYPFFLTKSSDRLPQNKPITISSPSSSSSFQVKEESSKEIPCDYTIGKWVPDKTGPLYNGTSCGTIKDGQNCLSHGRPDLDYLYWRWQPDLCKLPRFEPTNFLRHLKNKNLAFIGDSLARNQLESLLCLLSTVSPPELVYHNGDDNKFRRWHIPAYNINVSIYWSPFLVKGIEKSSDNNLNRLYLDSVDERWASDMGKMDMIVLAVGHWFLLPAVYFEEDSVLGCHYCPALNHTEIGFYDIYRKAFKTTLKAIIERSGTSGNAIDVIVTTFTPSHFEGDWDKAGACPKKRPFEEGEKAVEGMAAEMRKIGVEEVAMAKAKAKAAQFRGLRLETLDVTKLSFMRPDGHPGPYMYPFPFANGVADRVHNDCVHWCLPGPIDTWNEILLEVIKRWETQSRRGG